MTESGGASRAAGSVYRLVRVAFAGYRCVPPAGFEPALTAPESVSLYSSDLPKRARRDLGRARIGRSLPTLRSEGVRPAFRLTLHDRHPGFGEARSAAVDMGGDLVAEVTVLLRAEPGELRADPMTGPAPA